MATATRVERWNAIRLGSPRSRRVLTLLFCYLLVAGFLILRQRARSVPTVFLDELFFGRVSQNLGYGEGFTFQGLTSPARSIYPFLIAPAWALFSGATALHAALAINALAMSSAIFPTYLIARRVVAFPWAVAAAVAAVLTPSMVWAGMLMTEALAYPLAALALLLTVRAVREPGWQTALVAALACAAAFAARTQLVILGVVLAVAILADLVRRPSLRRQLLRSHAPAIAVVATMGVGAIALILARRQDILFGDHACVVAAGAPLGRSLGKAVDYIGVGFVAWLGLPLLALLALGSRSAPWRERELGALLVVASAAVVALIAQAAFTAATVSPQLQERYVFYAAPVLTPLVPCLARRVSPRAIALTAVAVALYMLLLFPGFADVTGRTVNAQLPVGGSLGGLLSDQGVLWAVAALGLGTVAALALRRAEHALAVVVLLGVTGVFGFAIFNVRQSDANNLSDGRRERFPQPPDWVDRETGGAPAGLVMVRDSPALALYTLQLTNRSVDRTYRIGIPDSFGPGQLCALSLDRRARLRLPKPCAGRGLPEYLLFIDGRYRPRLAGTAPIRAEHGMSLYRVGDAGAAPSRVLGIPRVGTIEPAEPPATESVQACRYSG